MDDAKILLRKKIRELKKQQFEQDKLKQSAQIFSQLSALPQFKKAKIILLYWSMDDEVQTQSFIQQIANQKQVLLPSVNGDVLELKKFEGMDSMISGDKFGILEPAGELFINYEAIDIIVVPGVAFDKNNNRMGRGRGYYDKLLSVAKALKIGVCYNYQFLDEIPVESHDIPMDLVLHA